MREWHAEVPLASYTTLGVGGPARWFATATDADAVGAQLQRAHDAGLPLLLLGGGSNLLVADRGFPGLALQLDDTRWSVEARGEVRRLFVGAGWDWDAVVARTCAEGWAGLEALSGIPGRTGAAPMQNIGAYGQELSSTLESVEVVDVATGAREVLDAAECGLGYRTSHFKHAWRGRWILTGLTLRLSTAPPSRPRYDDLASRLPDPSTPQAIRDVVLAVRRGKGMVLDPRDPDTRSAGSFFTNPVVAEDRAEQILELARTRDPAAAAGRWFPAGPGRAKLSAAWLIERAGVSRGYRRGTAGVSSKHVLALMNPGDATAADLLALAVEIRRRVEGEFGVALVPEPVLVGFQPEEIAPLAPPDQGA